MKIGRMLHGEWAKKSLQKGWGEETIHLEIIGEKYENEIVQNLAIISPDNFTSMKLIVGIFLQ